MTNPSEQTQTVSAGDGTQLHYFRWEPAGPVKAIVQVCHGLAEHAERYGRFAQAANAAGYAVYAQDHRGHGRTGQASGQRGVFAERDGWDTVVADLHTVGKRIRADHPGLPVFLLGHSMGSFLARAYAIRHGREIAGLVLSGTAMDPGLLGKVGGGIAAVIGKARGRATPSKLLDTMSFGKYNAAFKPNRTDYDWLSRDNAEVDRYVADPECGWVASAGMFQDLVGGLSLVNRDAEVRLIPADLPIALFSGELDPVGGRTAVTAVAAQLRRVGVVDVTTHVYPGARHEILNETNRDEVMGDILEWLDTHLPD